LEIFKLIGSIFIKTDEANESIDDTTKKVQDMASKVGSTMTTVGDKMSSVGTKLLPVSVAIGGLGVTAVKASAEVKAMNSQFEQTFGELQDQASGAMNRVATESGILQTRLQGVGTSIYAFAKSSGADSAEAMELMETALRATADASAYYDRSLEDTSESLMSFLKGNFANDAQLGVSCTETTRNAKAMELFGQKYNDLSEIQKQQTLLKMVTDAQALSGAMGQASRESDGFENVMGNMKESVKQAGAELGEVLLPTVIKLIQGVTGLIQKFSQMDDGTKKLIVTIAGIVAGLGPVLIVVGKVISSVGTIITNIPKIVSGVKMVASGAKALWAVLSANPIGLIITAITALVAGFIYLWNNCEEFRNFWINLWESIKTIISDAVTAVGGFLTGLWDDITNGFNSAKETVSNILNSIKDKFSSIFETVKTTVKNGIDYVKGLFNFSWSLPKLKLPHFSIKGSFSLNPPSVPKLGIEWYKDGGVMLDPTIFGFNGNKAMVGGEAGAEAIAPIDILLGYIRTAVAEQNASLIQCLKDAIDDLGKKLSDKTEGDIVIPVYIGETMIDDIIVNSKKNVRLRSGGLTSV
jgi:phage-related minor tail protein